MMLFLKKYFDNLACSQNLAKPSSYIGWWLPLWLHKKLDSKKKKKEKKKAEFF
jgi:hypothetical protein